MAVDISTNLGSAVIGYTGTASSSGTDAPTAGTVETWTSVTSQVNIPAAATGLTQFRIVDAAEAATPALAEVMLVTNVSGATWTVTRGAEATGGNGTTPVAHAQNWTALVVQTNGSLQNFGYVSQGGAVVDGSTWNTPDSAMSISSTMSAAGTSTQGSANQTTVTIQSYMNATSSAAAYEKAALMVEAKTNDPTTGAPSPGRNCVAVVGYGIGANTNTNCTVWGGNFLAEIQTGGTGDGSLCGIEVDIGNYGVDQATISATNTKTNILLVNYAGNSTAGLRFAGPGIWHHAIYAPSSNIGTSAGDTFIELYDGTHATDAYAINYLGAVTQTYYGTANAYVINNQTTGTSINLEDTGMTTGQTVYIVASAITSGQMISVNHAGSAMTGNGIQINLGQGGGTFTGYYVACYLNSSLKWAIQSGGVTVQAGTNTAVTGAAVLTPSFAQGVASQLSDATKDYMVYLNVTTAGTATTLAIGATSGVANVIKASSAATLGDVYSVRLPAGWYLKWAGTTTAIATQLAVAC